MILDKIELWAVNTNSWVIGRGKGGPAVLVDAPPDLKGVLSLLARNEFSLAGVILTHGHIDHMGSAQGVVEKSGATLFVHPADDFLTLDPLRQLRLLFGEGFPGDYGVPGETVALTDGENVSVAGIDLRVIHTPGHTPGHCCLFLEQEGWLFSGDHLFAGSVGRTDLPGGDWSKLCDSMREKILPFPDETRVLPGHGPETTIGIERRSNPFLVGL